MKKRFLIMFALGAAAAASQAQIVITGVSDNSIYTDSVTFTVSTAAGYSYDARLDGEPVPVGSPVMVTAADYHELAVARTNDSTLAVESTLVQFIITTAGRGLTESGLPAFTPYPLIPAPAAAFAESRFRLLVPSAYPAGMDIPAVVWVVNESNQAVRANGYVAAPGQAPIKLFRGVGSGFLQAGDNEILLDFTPVIGEVSTNRAVAIETNTAWTDVGGTLSGSIVWSNGSRIAVISDLTLSSGAALTIEAGTVVRVGPGLDIHSQADVMINGTPEDPVVFAPVSANQPWGGFIMPDSQGSVTATWTIFTGSGEDQDWLGTVGPGSHRPEQPLFACGADNAITLTDSAAISLAGQLGHSETGSDITLTRFLLQHATTGGEYENAVISITDSALICFPSDSAVFEDGDHDAIYIKNGTHGFTNTLFGWTKDDGVDSGGDGAGLLEFRNCWFEGTFHEANSLSGSGKYVNHRHDVFLGSGQALEAGYGAPHGLLESCLVSGNIIGARFGDNYSDGRAYNGSMSATNSLLLYNYRDAWGYQWNDWLYHTNRMSIAGNWLSSPLVQHPDNLVWNPASDGWRVAEFVNTPPGAPVGIGLAVHAVRHDLSDLATGVPVGLSCFATNTVTADYVIDTPDGVLAAGSVSLLPGQVFAQIPPPEAVPPSAGLIRVRLTEVAGAELTGVQETWFLLPPSDLIAAGSVWRYLDDGSDGGTAWREPGYDDAAWASGPAELGYGDGDEATVVSYGPSSASKYVTTYFRHTFEVPNPDAVGGLTLRLKRDDGGIVYLNGTEVFRSNMPTGTVDYLTYTPVFAADDGGSWFTTNVPASLLTGGDNVLAAEIHQSTPDSSDLTFDCGLSATPLPVIESEWFGSDWVLFWQDAGYTLESTPSLDGPWASLGTPGPYTVPYAGTNGFYRLIKP